MKVIEYNKFGQPTGWQQGQNKMFLEKFSGGQFYLVEKPMKFTKNGKQNITVCETFLKFKDAKGSLIAK